MNRVLHIFDGDSAAMLFPQTGINGEILTWRDELYDGPRTGELPPGDDELLSRAKYLEGDNAAAGAPTVEQIYSYLKRQYRELKNSAESGTHCVLWFDACLFDQSMLVHILACMSVFGVGEAELICPETFPGMPRFNGLGELSAKQLASLYDSRTPLCGIHFKYAERADYAFARRSPELLRRIAEERSAPLEFVPAAAQRLLEEIPDPDTGLGLLEKLAYESVCEGASTPAEIFKKTAGKDAPPQYWGDSRLWRILNRLASREKPLIKISGKYSQIPSFAAPEDLRDIVITPR